MKVWIQGYSFCIFFVGEIMNILIYITDLYIYV